MDRQPIQRIPFYIETETDVLLCWCHAPQRPSGHAVVICPPVGHEFVNSYRSLRHLADRFAQAGVAAFRIEYQGIGDSSGADTQPHRLQSWLDSIAAACQFIQENCKVKSISLLGLRMGATLAAMLGEHLDLHALICWAPVPNGRRYVREMFALQQTGEVAGLTSDDSIIEGGGFVLTEDAIQEISAVSLTDVVPKRAKHVFLFIREGITIPSMLIDYWSANHPSFRSASLPGYDDMLALPHHTKVPFDAIETILDSFLKTIYMFAEDEELETQPLKAHQQCQLSFQVYASLPDNGISLDQTYSAQETLCLFSDVPLFAIMSQPLPQSGDDRPTVLLLNAGSVHHIGPNRNYIFLTRELLALGFNVMRLDLFGLGDSTPCGCDQENNPYMPQALDNIHMAIQFLQERFGVREVILMGLCSGAYASFQAALHLDEVPIREIVLINPLTFYWRDGLSLDVVPFDPYWDWERRKKSMWKIDHWFQIFQGKKNLKTILSTTWPRFELKLKAMITSLANGFKRLSGLPGLEDLSYDLKIIAKRGIYMRFFFADTDPGYQILTEAAGQVVRRLRAKKKLTISFVPKANHTFATHQARSLLLRDIAAHFASRYVG
jgi:alpha-beta hydrolase superfamily lysophospholipase